MRQLFLKLWKDDSGAIISTEWVLVVSVMIFGLIPGLVAIRNAVNAAEATIGNSLVFVAPSFSYEGFAIVGVPNVGGFGGGGFGGGGFGFRRPIAYVNGYSTFNWGRTMFQSTSIMANNGNGLFGPWYYQNLNVSPAP